MYEFTCVFSTYAANEAAAERHEIAEAKDSRRKDTLPRQAALFRSISLLNSTVCLI